MKGLIKVPLILAAVIIVARIGLEQVGAPGTITVRVKNPACLRAVTKASDWDWRSTMSSSEPHTTRKAVLLLSTVVYVSGEAS